MSAMNRSDVLGILAAMSLVGTATDGADAQTPAAAPGMRPQDVVAAQVAAVNAHDAASVTKWHAANATLTSLPSGQVMAAGSDAILALFTKFFGQMPQLQLKNDHQYVLKNVVVNHYVVSNGPGPELVSIYAVENDVIANEWVIFG